MKSASQIESARIAATIREQYPNLNQGTDLALQTEEAFSRGDAAECERIADQLRRMELWPLANHALYYSALIRNGCA